MKTSNNTVLITGGSAGIGFEIAQQLSEQGNQVIITGRNAERLQAAAARLKNTTAIVSDVSSQSDVTKLVNQLNEQFPQLNIVINNAGYSSSPYRLLPGVDTFEKASAEIHTNYLSVLRLNELLLPLLNKQAQAAIVNVSSIVSFAPSIDIPGYSISKAALHAYSRVLRLTLKDTPVRVFELMPPLVNTEFSKEIGGEKGIPPSQVAADLLDGLKNDNYEIHVGNTADIYQLYLSSPENALQALNSNK
ncbi:SDR family oxidoreductase [Chitinophaga silvisoli]|uniref:SDR family NAD(P)-dependent oxidoreductase n=1 Tax=Chitinophaga silvisoli TaxID=2291814 RepID=A0A3E1NVI0_9BACT|nr:SDR family NAD(P)-dependent oxidoreductase [Chitinophaga silvisoli]RFM31778.1 SDR family NAD(P)-dependent oxidoreductase [Chitinophaga silvisoli]